ncbi:hypothetical protein [Larkinella soli]|uniref:hypothetical protein n=1 Tax=Larkinella soli TaxID=1770527 RepID=UPI000FFBA2EA|nr:hypothetical protein [Larkinella soli]
MATYAAFEACCKPAGGADRANYGLFTQNLCHLIGVARPDPTTDHPAQDAYVLERAVEFNDHGIPDQAGDRNAGPAKAAERAELGLSTEPTPGKYSYGRLNFLRISKT